jgi:glycogen debranching enzyme
MESAIRIEDSFYILATESAVESVSRVLKDGESFAVFDRYGDIRSTSLCQDGLYHEGTRFLSDLIFKLGTARPFLLNSTVKDDNLFLVVNLTNPDLYHSGQLVLPRGTLFITRTKLLRGAICYEQLKFANYGLSPVELRFTMEFEADYADIFEVRGVKRERRGRRQKEPPERDRLCFVYEGLDGVVRRTRMSFAPAPQSLTATTATFSQLLEPQQESEFLLTYACEINNAIPVRRTYPKARAEAEARLRAAQAEDCGIWTSNEQFNQWLARSFSDLHMMFTDTGSGLYPYAGVPWFSAAFGRDGIITALEFLWVNSSVAKGVLRYLASMQARESNSQRDAEPGKILHEARRGEMAALGEIPFDCYYGSVDATPLFVILAGAYLESTSDLEFLESIWPQLDLALRWLDEYGDADGNGFIEYSRRSAKGLLHQGWKDSWDSVFHHDGSLATAPIALCEVQGYAYAARLAGAAVASVLGKTGHAELLRQQADRLKQQFQSAFWSDEISTFVLALDGRKQPCQVRTSNPGHCLFSGIANLEQAGQVGDMLISENSFSGWGVRTVASSEARYNPMSYHNGSVWPHDNALVAAGLARYGFKEYANRIFSALFDASSFFELRRLPELFCGFSRRDGEGPVPYPVACSPQSWAAGAVFLLLQASLGLTIDATSSTVRMKQPLLPDFLDEVRVRKLRVGEALLDLSVERRGRTVGVQIESQAGTAYVTVEP